MYFVVVRITNGCVNRMKLSEGRAGDIVRCGSMGRVDGMVQESKELRMNNGWWKNLNSELINSTSTFVVSIKYPLPLTRVQVEKSTNS